MCITCTSTRVEIAACQIHTVGILPSKEIAANMNAAADLAGGHLKEHQWCTICPQLATHKCTKKQGDGCSGCGLKMCDDCASWLVKDFKGDLEELIERLIAANIEYSAEEETFNVRPDATFLLSRGELLTRLPGLLN